MMIGGGFLKQMNDTLKYNRDLLKKKNRFKEARKLYKQEIKNKGASFQYQDLEHIKLLVETRLQRNRVREMLQKALALLLALALVAFLIWFLTNLLG
jgi:hypothetical protein